ncbi:MAG: hypothetical protein BMS9Abin20_1068 [Acidimicrobiia bacterium]|nr:MAG: hypothetical protein BMS9Abin20_1068 [Acidimicrobiia bacterium]
MIRHVALFRFKEGVTDETIDHIDDVLATLPDIVDEIVTFASGRDVGITDGAWDYAVVSDFASVEDYRTYASNPDHVDMVKNVVGPNVAEAARVQFTVVG